MDEVPLHIDKNFIREFSRQIFPLLVKSLGIFEDGAEEKCKRWLSESPDIVLRRDRLLGRKRTLEAAQEELLRYELRA